ncbi:hypothetical protein N752_07650 [Desulforamulus aquiferis]|nr:hypothetical protein N752_07650 [Desulforamulus aquiferis]
MAVIAGSGNTQQVTAILDGAVIGSVVLELMEQCKAVT